MKSMELHQFTQAENRAQLFPDKQRHAIPHLPPQRQMLYLLTCSICFNEVFTGKCKWYHLDVNIKHGDVLRVALKEIKCVIWANVNGVWLLLNKVKMDKVKFSQVPLRTTCCRLCELWHNLSMLEIYPFRFLTRKQVIKKTMSVPWS